MPNGKKILFGAFALLLLLAGRAFGQQKESLLIGPGDMLHITVFDSPEFEQHVRVSDAGDIVLVLGGKVHVAGQTPAEAAHSVESALKSGGIMNYPRVAVLVEEYATQSVYITGEVKAPGARAIRTPLSVIDVLTMAGGLTGAADRKILIQRRGTKELVPYFVSNDANVAFQSAVTVYPGDTVIVPKAGIVYMLGDVKTPGGYTMTNNEGKISVLELVARAGGTNHSAVPQHTVLIRKKDGVYVEQQLPLSSMQKGKVADMYLQPDDILYVPFSYLRNFALNSANVVGEVGAAAVYQF